MTTLFKSRTRGTKRIDLTPQELANALFTLRLWQEELEDLSAEQLAKIADRENFGIHEPLTSTELSSLIKRIQSQR